MFFFIFCRQLDIIFLYIVFLELNSKVSCIHSLAFIKSKGCIEGILLKVIAFLNTFKTLLFLSLSFLTIASINKPLSICKYFKLIIFTITFLLYKLEII